MNKDYYYENNYACLFLHSRCFFHVKHHLNAWFTLHYIALKILVILEKDVVADFMLTWISALVLRLNSSRETVIYLVSLLMLLYYDMSCWCVEVLGHRRRCSEPVNLPVSDSMYVRDSSTFAKEFSDRFATLKTDFEEVCSRRHVYSFAYEIKFFLRYKHFCEAVVKCEEGEAETRPQSVRRYSK